MRHIFQIYHPAVIFAYIASAVVCAMLTLQPVFVAISLCIGCLYAIYLNGARRFFSSMKFFLVVFAVVAVANPLFNHKGLTVLFRIGNNPVTLEACVYGLCAAAMLLSIFVWFQCYQVLMTNDKFLFLFGKAVPGAALLTSMILKWIPQTQHKMENIRRAQAVLEQGAESETKKHRIANTVNMTGILMSWSMEDSIETADSMRARGYGAAKRTSFCRFRMGAHDVVSLCIICALAAISVFMILARGNAFVFYPYLSGLDTRVWTYLPYVLLLLCPLILEGKERLKWR